MTAAPNAAEFPPGSPLAKPIYLVDANGNQITSFGGGTQYTDAASTVAHPTGTMPVFDNSGTISKVSLAVGLPVNVVAGTISAENPSVLVDDATFTVATSSFTTVGGVYNDSAAAATSGHADAARLSQNRGLHINIRNNAGTELATASNPLQVSLANTATNATAVKVDGSAVTQPVSGTVTANAGTNLNTSSLALDASVNGVLLSQGSTTSGQKGPLILGAVTTNAPSYTTAQSSPLSLDTSGLLRASLKDTPANTNNLNINLAASAATVTVSATNLSTNMAQVAGATTSVDMGTSGSGTQRVIVAGAATGTKSNVSSSASSVTILASNTSRKGAMVYNDSTQVLYLDLSGGTASSTSYSVQLAANAFFELPGPTIYNGLITGIWASANGNARVTEWT